MNHIIYKTFSLSLLLISMASFAGDHPRLNNPLDNVWHIQLNLNEGRKIVTDLDRHFGLDSTTSFRRETKATVHESELKGVMEKLQKGNPGEGIEPLVFRNREGGAGLSQLHGNFTYYGRAAGYLNDGGRKTAIRMRVRIYVNFDDHFKQVTRIPEMANMAYLEIKIKNPNDQEPDGVHKYRINLKDEDVLKLFRADPNAANFSTVLQELKTGALSLHTEGNTEEKVSAIFAIIESLAKRDRSFIQPLFVTSYSRDSISYTQDNYEVPLPAVKKEKRFSNLWGHLGEKYETPGKEKVKAEFQITMDKNVHAFTAQVFPEDTVLDIQRYFSPDFKGQTVTYPDDAVVVELKEPGGVSQLRTSQKSATHRWIDDTLVQFMKLNHLPQFLVNRGKAGHLTRMLRSRLFASDQASSYDDTDLD